MKELFAWNGSLLNLLTNYVQFRIIPLSALFLLDSGWGTY